MKVAVILVFFALMVPCGAAHGQTWEGKYGTKLTLAGNGTDITNTVTITAPSGATPYTLQLPTTAGTSGYYLQTNGSGVTTWAAASGSGTVNSGTAGQLGWYATTGTAISGNANATISSGALSLGVAGSALGTLSVSGNTSGTVTIQPQATAGTYNFNLPTGAGTSGQPLLSAGGGASPMTFGTLGVGGGGSGLATRTAHSIQVGNGTANVTQLAVGASGQMLTGSTGADPVWTVTPTLGVAGASTGTLALTGVTSGTVTIQPQSTAGTYNFNLPTSAGTSGQPLLSGGGGSGAQTYGTLGVGAGGTNITTYTTGDILFASSTSALSKLAIGTSAQFLIGGTTPAYASPNIGATLTGNGISTSLGIDLTHANTWTGTQTVGAIVNSSNAPTTLAANTNNWTIPTTASYIYISASTPVNLTGIVAGTDGAHYWLVNNGTSAITLTNEDAASTATNRFHIIDNKILSPDGCFELIYDGTSTNHRWRILASNN